MKIYYNIVTVNNYYLLQKEITIKYKFKNVNTKTIVVIGKSVNVILKLQ